MSIEARVRVLLSKIAADSVYLGAIAAPAARCLPHRLQNLRHPRRTLHPVRLRPGPPPAPNGLPAPPPKPPGPPPNPMPPPRIPLRPPRPSPGVATSPTPPPSRKELAALVEASGFSGIVSPGTAFSVPAFSAPPFSAMRSTPSSPPAPSPKEFCEAAGIWPRFRALAGGVARLPLRRLKGGLPPGFPCGVAVLSGVARTIAKLILSDLSAVTGIGSRTSGRNPTNDKVKR